MADVNLTGLKWVAARYVQLLGGRVTKTTVRNTIEENPGYPSLLSLTETFSKFNMDSVAYEIDQDKLAVIPTPFIALLSMENVGQDFVIVTQVREDRIEYQYKTRKKLSLPTFKFGGQFRKVIFMGESTEMSGEPDFLVNKRKETRLYVWRSIQIGLAILLLGIVLFEVSPENRRTAFGLIYLFKTIGILIAGMLIYYEIDKNNAFIKSICTVFKRTNCDAVLDSKAARIFGVSWAEVGFLYFSSTFIWLLFGKVPEEIKYQWVVLANILASPYIVFSIYYQLVIIRQWCALCLLVQMVLATELVWGIMNFNWLSGNFFNAGMFHSDILLIIFTSVLMPFLIWNVIKPLLVSAGKYPSSASEVKRLKSNPEIFKAILNQNRPIVEGWENLGIDLGNPAAANTIVKICNPYCGPCARMHEELEHLIRGNANLKLKIIFTADPSIDDSSVAVVGHFLAVNAEKSQGDIQRCLDDWYSGGKTDFERFKIKYPSNPAAHTFDTAISTMSAWCKKSDIAVTPTVFINGFELPGDYSIAQLNELFLVNAEFNRGDQ